MLGCHSIKKEGTQDGAATIGTMPVDVVAERLGTMALVEELLTTTTMQMWRTRKQAVLVIIAPMLMPILKSLSTFLVSNR
jgi:hypothetical protein